MRMTWQERRLQAPGPAPWGVVRRSGGQETGPEPRAHSLPLPRQAGVGSGVVWTWTAPEVIQPMRRSPAVPFARLLLFL